MLLHRLTWNPNRSPFYQEIPILKTHWAFQVPGSGVYHPRLLPRCGHLGGVVQVPLQCWRITHERSRVPRARQDLLTWAKAHPCPTCLVYLHLLTSTGFMCFSFYPVVIDSLAAWTQTKGEHFWGHDSTREAKKKGTDRSTGRFSLGK